MELKLNYRLPQTADRQAAYQTGVESELRRRLQLAGKKGIVSADGTDVDNDSAPCAVFVNVSDESAIDVSAGTVVFGVGEYVDVFPNDISGVRLDSSETDAQVIRLEYGEIEAGDLEANPYYNFAARPKTRKKTPREMLVIETITAYNSLSADALAKSVVLAVARFANTSLSVDNSRDTYSFSRPWSSVVDTEHRSFVGSGAVTPTNPHGTTANDLTVGNYSMWQALAGPPACVLARPVSVGRVPGTLCSETIPSGAFTLDSTGRVTGKINARYAYLGYWPERLTRACLSSNPGTEVAAWIPRGRNVIAVDDPVNFAPPANIEVYYTKVEAGALPGSLLGLTTIEVGQPNSNELLVAGGSLLTSLSEPKVTFTDVGLIPMNFDIMVGNDGKVYKRPDCIYCNTSLDSIGASPAPFSIQPKVPSRLRVAVSNYVPALTSLKFQISGFDEAGASISEQVEFSGPLPSPAISYVEQIGQRKFTTKVFASVTQFQVLVRNGDGPNTTVSVFAEYVPERPGVGDDLLLASVLWSGADVSAFYANGSNNANVVLDRRTISRGGPNRGLTPIGTYLTTGAMNEGLPPQGPFSSQNWVTLVEDFADPQWICFPSVDAVPQDPIELPSSSLGARLLYRSRLMPFVVDAVTPTSLFLRLLTKSIHDFPNSAQDLTFRVILYSKSGSLTTLEGDTTSIVNNPYPPYQLKMTVSPLGDLLSVGQYYAAKLLAFSATVGASPMELFQGFVLQIRD